MPLCRLDPEAVQTCHRLAGLLFPWDITRALELALLKTFCLPSISGLLSRTGEFEQRPRKRYDDTGLMVAELLRHGPDSRAGAAVIARMNRIHGHYTIGNDDFLYVLSGFVAEPILWLERYGWRPLNPDEQQALFRFWRHVGARMGIAGLPATLTELLDLNLRVEAELFRPALSNRRVADATLAMLLSAWPAPLRPSLEPLLQGLLAPQVARSLQWQPAPGWLRELLRLALRARSAVANLSQRLSPPRRTRFYSQAPTPSYGPSFRLEQLGPPPLLERLNSPRWSGGQRRIGLTGGIASGKSSVGRLLAAQGLPVLDADEFAREALAPGSPGALAVLIRYGDAVRAGNGGGGAVADAATIDRAALGRIVFADPRERSWLEQLIHPIVRDRFKAELSGLVDAPAVVLMIPLLFETGLEALCSEVWLVDCDPAQQLQRLIGRDGLSEADASARIAAQWPLERKRPLADRVINNRGPADQLAAQVQAALNRWSGRALGR
jgi:dephospho-CoA kinase